MRNLLTGLGIPEEIQALFNLGKPIFDYGDTIEHFGADFHLVPTTKNLWVAGEPTASEIVITASAMEAIAFLTIYRRQYPKAEQMAIVSIGSKLFDEQSAWIRTNFKGRKFTFVFGNDYLGRLTDIKMAAGLKNKQVKIYHHRQQTIIESGTAEHAFHNDKISLFAFERAFGWRSGIRSRKPKIHNTFLDELKWNKIISN